MQLDSPKHHFEETTVIAGCGVRAVGTNELNTYRGTERKTWFSECKSILTGGMLGIGIDAFMPQTL